MLYRILTENKNENDLNEIVAGFFGGYFSMEGEGRWKGQSESSLVFEVETDELEQVNNAARAIKEHNGQEAVTVQQIPNHAWLI
jgi:uncharacterized membrane-anchored protein YitT (DUF2179 family)